MWCCHRVCQPPGLPSDVWTKANLQAAGISGCKGVWLQPVGRALIIHNSHRPAKQSSGHWHQNVGEVMITRRLVLVEVLPDQGYVNWCLWDLDTFCAEPFAERNSHLMLIRCRCLAACLSYATRLVLTPCRPLAIFTAILCRAAMSALENLRLFLLTSLTNGHQDSLRIVASLVL